MTVTDGVGYLGGTVMQQTKLETGCKLGCFKLSWGKMMQTCPVVCPTVSLILPPGDVLITYP